MFCNINTCHCATFKLNTIKTSKVIQTWPSFEEKFPSLVSIVNPCKTLERQNNMSDLQLVSSPTDPLVYGKRQSRHQEDTKGWTTALLNLENHVLCDTSMSIFRIDQFRNERI